MKIDVSAPGKLVLIGEYGVLFGAPALVMAIDRRARVELTPAEGDRWILTAPGLTPRPIELGISPDGLLSWRDEALASQYFDLVDRLLRELFCGNLVTPEGLGPAAATLDTRPFFRSGDRVRRKLGLGSSAALTVALASALVGWSAAGCVPVAGRQWLQTLVGLNRRVQGGLGSGIDIAASVLGGVIEYQMDDQGSVAKAAPMSIPGDLGLLCIWTGRSASTVSFLKRLEDRRSRDRRTVERAIDGVVDASRAGVDAIRTVSSSGFLDAVDRFWGVLEGLGRVIDLPIVSEEHQRLRRLACDVGVRYKPSGAGGGDFGLAFDTDRERLAAMAARAEGGGFEVVGLGLDPVGVACDVVET